MTHAASDQPAANPFVQYAAVMPGQPKTTLPDDRFRCTGIPYYLLCVERPTSGPFSRINAIVNGNTIENVHFTVREHALTVGDLILLWGRPDHVQYGRNPTILFWEQVPASAIILREMNNPLAYFQSLHSVSIGVEYEETPVFVDSITLDG
jgi:hypothetical protein